MLTRVIWMVCIVWCVQGSAFSQGDDLPHVIVVLADDSALPVADELDGFSVQTGALRLSPSRAATLASILYGKKTLHSGVVSDADWRRKPVSSSSIIESYKKSGYNTYFKGADLTSALSGAKPSLAIISRGNGYTQKDIGELWAEKKLAGENERSVVILTLNIDAVEGLSKRGRVADQFHYSGHYRLYQSKPLFQVSDLQIDFQLYSLLEAILEGKRDIHIEKPDFYFFHKSNWALGEAVEKFRHRDSLVVGNGFALVDGLDLYAASEDLLPDLSKKLEVEDYPIVYADLLRRHALWWQEAKAAISNPRAFDVGTTDQLATILTVNDWRASNIVRSDETSPSTLTRTSLAEVVTLLTKLKDSGYREKFPPSSGSWALNIIQPGRYEITARLLPAGINGDLAKLKAGRAFVQLGGNQVQLQMNGGSSAITITVDADAGYKELECWFTGQLPLERELGAFYVEIKRIGEKKYQFSPK